MRAKQFFGEELPAKVDPERIKGISHSYVFDVTGEGRWLVEIRDGKLAITESPESDGDVKFTLSGDTFDRITDRKQNPMVAYMTGKVKVSGDVKAAADLQKIL
jgi:putative sterol carrier protein